MSGEEEREKRKRELDVRRGRGNEVVSDAYGTSFYIERITKNLLKLS